VSALSLPAESGSRWRPAGGRQANITTPNSRRPRRVRPADAVSTVKQRRGVGSEHVAAAGPPAMLDQRHRRPSHRCRRRRGQPASDWRRRRAVSLLLIPGPITTGVTSHAARDVIPWRVSGPLPRREGRIWCCRARCGSKCWCVVVVVQQRHWLDWQPPAIEICDFSPSPRQWRVVFNHLDGRRAASHRSDGRPEQTTYRFCQLSVSQLVVGAADMLPLACCVLGVDRFRCIPLHTSCSIQPATIRSHVRRARRKLSDKFT